MVDAKDRVRREMGILFAAGFAFVGCSELENQSSTIRGG
jgi:hypothetical protein